MIKQIAALVMMATLLSGCGTMVEGTVTVFHTLPSKSSGETISIINPDKEKDGVLEFKSYAAMLASGLEKSGYRVVPFDLNAKPNYVAILNYGIDNGTMMSRTYAIPRFGVTGYSGSTTTGNISTYGNTASLNTTTTNIPTYGVTGYNTGVQNYKIYDRTVSLDIYDQGKIVAGDDASMAKAQIYTGRVKSSGTCQVISGVMQALLLMLTKDFPVLVEKPFQRQSPLLLDPAKHPI